MAKEGLERPDAPDSGASRNLTPEFYQEQAQAVEERLRRYLDDRLNALAPSSRYGAPASEPGWRRRRPELYGAILLLLVVGLTWPPPFLSGGDEGEPSAVQPEVRLEHEVAPRARNHAVPIETAPSVQLPSDSETAWEQFVEQNRQALVVWSQAVLQARGLAEDEVSAQQKKNFRSFAQSLSRGEMLSKDQRDLLRRGLFEYIYGCWSRSIGSPPKDFVVNQRFERYDAVVLRALADSLSLPANLALEDPQANVLLQYLVVGRTIEQQDPPSGTSGP